MNAITPRWRLQSNPSGTVKQIVDTRQSVGLSNEKPRWLLLHHYLSAQKVKRIVDANKTGCLTASPEALESAIDK
jgi:hypothetical protein